jgi:hypothetical protein
MIICVHIFMSIYIYRYSCIYMYTCVSPILRILQEWQESMIYVYTHIEKLQQEKRDDDGVLIDTIGIYTYIYIHIYIHLFMYIYVYIILSAVACFSHFEDTSRMVRIYDDDDVQLSEVITCGYIYICVSINMYTKEFTKDIYI